MPIPNDAGTAPGIRAEKGGTLFFALPGVPKEMRHMLDVSVLPELRSWGGEQAIVARRLRCFGAGESTIAEMLGETMARGRNPLVNCTAHTGIITLEVVATAMNRGQAEEMAAGEAVALRKTLGSLVYGVGEQTLAEVVGEALARRRQTIAVAESCTGGLLAAAITDVPGASRYFTCGWITYSNEAKHRELGVPEALIARHGAVSEKVASAMAQGARRRASADVAVSITGIAGPAGGTEHKPVGLVYIAVSHPGGTDTSRHVFSRDRGSVRTRAVQTALDRVRLRLEI